MQLKAISSFTHRWSHSSHPVYRASGKCDKLDYRTREQNRVTWIHFSASSLRQRTQGFCIKRISMFSYLFRFWNPSSFARTLLSLCVHLLPNETYSDKSSRSLSLSSLCLFVCLESERRRKSVTGGRKSCFSFPQQHRSYRQREESSFLWGPK